MEPKPVFVGGRWITTKNVQVVKSPYDGREAGSCCLAGDQEMELALEAAARASNETPRLPTHIRSAICSDAAKAIASRSDDFADLITAETGKPIKLSRGEVGRAVITFQLAAEAAHDALGEVLPADAEARTEGYLALAVRVPRGPVAAISPFNFPLNLVAHKVAPALAAGCPIVLKPPPQAPLTSLLLAEVLEDCGIPGGFLSVLPCEVAVAERMVTDDRIRTLSFTGSAKVGWNLRNAADRKHVLLELGGNAAAIVHGDADLPWAVSRLAMGAFAHAGQVCISVQRIFVQDDIYDRFKDAFLEEAARVPTGDPWDPDTLVGPVIDSASADRVTAWVNEAEEAGSSVHSFGERQGNLLPLYVIDNASPSIRVSCEEVFGPVVALYRYSDFREALNEVNRGVYGLQAGIFTSDIGLAFEAVWRLDVGGVIVNDFPTFRVDSTPYGGTKDSGMGREGVRYAVEEMSEYRTVIFRGGLPTPQ